MSSGKSNEAATASTSKSTSPDVESSTSTSSLQVPVDPLCCSNSKNGESSSLDVPTIIESRASSIEPYSDDSDYEVEVEEPEAEADEADDDEAAEHEYIIMLQDDTTREEFDAVIQDAKNQGMIIKSKTFSSLSKFQIKSFTVKTSELKLQGWKSLQSNKIRFTERNQTVRIQPSRRSTRLAKDAPETTEQGQSSNQGAPTNKDASATEETLLSTQVPK